jgi:two-component system sensor histidine kinase MtrB
VSSGGSRSRGRRRLRFRVAFAFAFGGLVLAATLALVTYLLCERYLLDQRVRLATRQAYLDARAVRDALPADAGDPATVLGALDVSEGREAFIARNGQWYASGLTTGPERVPVRLRRRVQRGEVGRQRYALDGSPVLTIGVPIRAVGAQFYEVFPLQELHNTLSAIRTALLAAAGITTAGAAILGTWAARRVLQPVNDVSTAAQRIATGDLAARLETQTDPDLDRVVLSFNSMADALETRIERDARFVSDVSHELRSPLTTLATATEVVERGADSLPPRVRDAVHLMSAEVTRFQRVVEELLELSRAEAQVDPLELESLNVGDLVLNVTTRYRSDPLVAEIDAEVARTPLQLDKRRLERIMVNLLENARAHGGGAVRVAAFRTDTMLRLEVEDAGPGIPLGERAQVFERFSRGSTSRARGADFSTGLGLALVAEHARVHGGAVWVEDRDAEPGCRFVVELPWRPA